MNEWWAYVQRHTGRRRATDHHVVQPSDQTNNYCLAKDSFSNSTRARINAAEVNPGMQKKKNHVVDLMATFSFS
jgi:hypothetical protein